MPLSLAYHTATKYAPETIGNHPPLDWSAQPPAIKDYDLDRAVELSDWLPLDPNPFTNSAAGAEAHAPSGLTLPGMSRLLFAAYGITGAISGATRPTYLRAAPSAGGLYPAELYVVVKSWPGLEPGVYGFAPLSHALVPLWLDTETGSTAAATLGTACYGNAQVTSAPASLVVTGVFNRSRWRYQERAYRRICLDSGHLCGNALLAAPEFQLRCGFTAAFSDGLLNRLLRVDAAAEGALAVLPINEPGEPERPTWSALPSPTGPADTPPPLLDALHRSSACGDARPRALLGSEADDALHARHGWTHTESLLGDGLAPNPLHGAVFGGILARRSTRSFTGGSCSTAQLARILAAGYLAESIGFGPQPSAARELLMTFVAITGVDGLADGLYYLAPHGLELRLVKDGCDRRALQFLGLGQELCHDACVTIYHAADLAAVARRFGDRAYRYLHLDAGIIGQRLNLAALAEGLGASGIGGFFDDQITTLLGIPAEQAVIYVTVIGVPG